MGSYLLDTLTIISDSLTLPRKTSGVATTACRSSTHYPAPIVVSRIIFKTRPRFNTVIAKSWHVYDQPIFIGARIAVITSFELSWLIKSSTFNRHHQPRSKYWWKYRRAPSGCSQLFQLSHSSMIQSPAKTLMYEQVPHGSSTNWPWTRISAHLPPISYTSFSPTVQQTKNLRAINVAKELFLINNRQI